MGMTPTEEAEWRRKAWNASTATSTPGTQGNSGAGTVDSQTNWWSTYNPAEGPSQAGGGKWADNQYNWDQDRMNRVATERNAYQGQVDQSRGLPRPKQACFGTRCHGQRSEPGRAPV